MKTGNLEFFRAVYGLEKSNDKGTTYDYTLLNEVEPGGYDLHPEIIRIEKDNGYHDRSREFDYWIYFRDETAWTRCTRSGLAFTNISNVYEGNISEEIALQMKTKKGNNHENPKHFIVCQFYDNWRGLVVDIFKDFYPIKRPLINAILWEHQYYIPLKKGA